MPCCKSEVRFYVVYPNLEMIRVMTARFRNGKYVIGSLKVFREVPRNPGGSGHDFGIFDIMDMNGDCEETFDDVCLYPDEL